MNFLEVTKHKKKKEKSEKHKIESTLICDIFAFFSSFFNENFELGKAQNFQSFPQRPPKQRKPKYFLRESNCLVIIIKSKMGDKSFNESSLKSLNETSEREKLTIDI